MDSAQAILRRTATRVTEGIDGTLLTLTLLLVALGLATLYSASYDNPARVAGQLTNLAAALAAMWMKNISERRNRATSTR